MNFKTFIAAALLTAAASTAIAQQTQQQQQQQNPLRPNQPAQPAQPAQPTQRTTQPAAPAPAPAAQPAQRSTAGQNQLVNLNTASKDELDKLPQIGDARAQAIISKRPYRDWNDFVAKGVVPSNAEAAIKDKVRFR